MLSTALTSNIPQTSHIKQRLGGRSRAAREATWGYISRAETRKFDLLTHPPIATMPLSSCNAFKMCVRMVRCVRESKGRGTGSRFRGQRLQRGSAEGANEHQASTQKPCKAPRRRACTNIRRYDRAKGSATRVVCDGQQDGKTAGDVGALTTAQAPAGKRTYGGARRRLKTHLATTSVWF